MAWNIHPPGTSAGRPSPPESPTLGFTHLQFEAVLTAARESLNRYDFALVAMLGLLGLRIFEATSADIADLGEEHGHRVLRVSGKGTKVVLIPLPPAVGRAIDRAIGTRTRGPILLNSRGARMDRHAATRRLRRLSDTAGVKIARTHPHMLRHTFVCDDHARRGRGPAGRADRGPPRRPEDHYAPGRARASLDRHATCPRFRCWNESALPLTPTSSWNSRPTQPKPSATVVVTHAFGSADERAFADG